MSKLVTEAMRRATPRPETPKGVSHSAGHGQKVSLERGKSTRSKKNPGKRPRRGG